MNRAFPLLLAFGCAHALASEPEHLVVVELFQSQGCSSCPPADLILNELAGRTGVLALNFAVTYWDRLGWKDTFALPAFTQRQYDYAEAAGTSSVWTPQFIVDGRVLPGGGKAALEERLTHTAHVARGPALSLTGAQLSISAAPGSVATVWLVQYDPRSLEVAVLAGENEGRTLPHRNVVRALTSLGQWTGSAATWTVPPALPGLERAILLQDHGSGQLLAARRLP
jgi:hypothetical protein